MSAPENPGDGLERPILRNGSEVPPDLGITDVHEIFPIWTAGDLVRVLVVLFLAMFFADTSAVLVADMLHTYRHTDAHAITTDARVVVPAQAVAYLLTVWFIVRMISRHYGANFAQAVHWRFPERWLKFILGGAFLALVLQPISSKLPIPRQMPIDQYFQSPLAAWIMALFGTFIAPFCEELFFRGLLFPVLVRRIGMTGGVVVTSVLFAFIHASQLANAWAPVILLFAVGVVLTLVRARAHSLAASVLVHTGYNAALFSLVYIGSEGFHNFTRLTQ